jgi:small Trp-rich protein
MYLVWTGAFLVALKLLQVGPFAELSWWWVFAPLALALVWFEGLEKVFGFDRRQVEHSDWEKSRKRRVTEQFGDPKAKAARRRA